MQSREQETALTVAVSKVAPGLYPAWADCFVFDSLFEQL